MNKFILGIFAYFFCCFFNSNLQAQSNYVAGYIVTIANDTIQGEIDYRAWGSTPKNIKFKTSPDSDIQKLIPIDLNAFHVGDDYFISRKVIIDKTTRQKHQLVSPGNTTQAEEHIFLQLLFQGTATLYVHLDQNLSSHFFIEKDQVPLTELVYQLVLVEKDGEYLRQKKTRYKGQLLYFLKDCPSLQANINSLRYLRTSFVKLFQKYQECKGGGEGIVYELPKSKAKFQVQLFAGAYNTNISMPSTDILEPSSYTSSLRPLVGIGAQFQLPGRFRNIVLSSDFHYKSYEDTDSWELGWTGFGPTPFTRLYETEVSVSYLKWTNMVRYRPFVKKSTPYVGLGFSQALLLNSENQVTLTRSHEPNMPETVPLLLQGEQQSEQGFVGALGFSNRKFNVELRYERANSFVKKTESPQGRATATTFILLVGYLF